MKEYQLFRQVAIPKVLIDNDFNLSDGQLLTMIRLFGQEQEFINLSNFLKQFKINRADIAQLKEMKLIDVFDKNDEIVIAINPFYSYQKNTDQGEILDVKRIDRIVFLLNRQLKTYELEMIKEWLSIGYTLSEIELAIQKSTINNVDNFKYIDTVLRNEKDKDQEIMINIQRNVDLY